MLVGRMWHDPRQMDSSRLSALPILANLPAAELDQLADVLGEVEVEAGAEFIRRDAYGTAVYFIEQGEAEVRMADGGTETLGPGDMCGEIALLLTGQRTATVVARTPTRLLQLTVSISNASGAMCPSSNACCGASAPSAYDRPTSAEVTFDCRHGPHVFPDAQRTGRRPLRGGLALRSLDRLRLAEQDPANPVTTPLPGHARRDAGSNPLPRFSGT